MCIEREENEATTTEAAEGDVKDFPRFRQTRGETLFAKGSSREGEYELRWSSGEDNSIYENMDQEGLMGCPAVTRGINYL